MAVKETKEEKTPEVKHKNLASAVIAVMKEVKGMEKNSRVGEGTKAAYDGTKDQDVKEVFNKVLAENGLCILPVDITEETQIDRWEETNQWGTKQRQSVFTKVNTRYKLIHESGESETLAGYGHGVDTQDKGAGKATTYALKNCLLYTFLTPVGKIDDTDDTHSQDHRVPGKTKTTPPKEETNKSPTKEQLSTRAVKLLESSKTLEELKANWTKVKQVQKEDAVIKAKEATKAKLTPKQ